MLSNKRPVSCFVFVWSIVSVTARASQADIGCPPTNDGKPLKGVELFVGPPSNKDEVMPERGHFVVPWTPRDMWDRFPASTLRCTYRDSTDMVTIVLPRYVRVCEFTDGPQVRCH